MGHIFISYSSRDLEQVEAIAAALESDGYEVWWDRKLQAHRAYGDEIEERLDAAAAVLVVWSEEAVRSHWVRSEADRARLSGKLVQTSIGAARLPMPFDQIQCVPIADPGAAAADPRWVTITASLAALLGGEQHAAPYTAQGAAHSPPPRPGTKTPPAAPLLAVALAAVPLLALVLGIAPPRGGVQAAILAATCPALFFISRRFLLRAGERTVLLATIAAIVAAFGLGVGYNLAAQRHVAVIGGERTVIGCGWRSDAVAMVRKQAPTIDADSQCPGEWDMIAPLVGGDPARLYQRDRLDLVWLVISMLWGALFLMLPVAAAGLLAIQTRPAKV